MKKTIYLLALAASLSLTACSDFLTVEEKGKVTIPTALSDPRSLQAALMGAYNAYYSHYDKDFLKYAEVAGNMVTLDLTSKTSVLEQYNFSPNPTSATTAYYIWYNTGIAEVNANNIVNYAPAVADAYPADRAKCEKILGQALLLRALCHFDLCRVYAQPYCYTADGSHLGVPVLERTPGPDDNPARATVKEVYDFILADLDRAAQLLTDAHADDVHYASLQAVRAMRARVCLYRQDWQGALAAAKEAINGEPLAQGEDYVNMYRDLGQRGEMIMRLSGQDQGGNQKKFYDTDCVPADQLLALYDADDVRLPLVRTGAGAAACSKYLATKIPDNDPNREDPILFRLSEMYLTAAEAACNLQQYAEARAYIEPLVSRAVGAEKAAGIMAATTDDALLDLVITERVKELCFEGHTFFDITRRGQSLVREATTNSTVRRIDWPSDLFVLPIPQYELDANENMKPNPTVN